jgi:transcriptional regulator with XRE-family HTH domain
MDFQILVHKAGLTQNEFCDLFNVSINTYKRYKQTNKINQGIKVALQLMAGEIPFSGFKGWYFKSGLLSDSNGNRFSSGDILGIIYDRQLIKSLEIENLKLKQQLDRQILKSNVIQFPKVRSSKLRA